MYENLKLNPVDDKFSIYESDSFQKLGTDTVLLSKFVRKKAGAHVCDLGCGQGGLSLLLLTQQPQMYIKGVEIQPDAAQIAQLNMRHNGFGDRFCVATHDMRQVRTEDKEKFDIVVSNPPYFGSRNGKRSNLPSRDTSRCDETCTPDELCQTAGALLRYGGDFYVVYRCERLTDMLCSMRSNRIEPKILQFVYATPRAKPKIVLITGKKYGKPSLTVTQPIFLA